MFTRNYERISRRLLNGMAKPRKSCRIEDGHFFVGYASSHRTQQARLWRQFWRLKNFTRRAGR
jgi:hypothetical protein